MITTVRKKEHGDYTQSPSGFMTWLNARADKGELESPVTDEMLDNYILSFSKLGKISYRRCSNVIYLLVHCGNNYHIPLKISANRGHIYVLSPLISSWCVQVEDTNVLCVGNIYYHDSIKNVKTVFEIIIDKIEDTYERVAAVEMALNNMRKHIPDVSNKDNDEIARAKSEAYKGLDNSSYLKEMKAYIAAETQ